MKRAVKPGARTGSVRVPASKSEAHRLMILAALGQQETVVLADGISKDIEATAACLRALGAQIEKYHEEEGQSGYRIVPIPQNEVAENEASEGERCLLPCGESGSTLRFLLPVVCALGKKAVFRMEGRLPERPLAPLDRELMRFGAEIEKKGEFLSVSGRLRAGAYCLPGNISSQYISGLLMALPLLEGESSLTVTGPIESAGYIAMTEEALCLADIRMEKTGNVYAIPGGQRSRLPLEVRAEGDYSGAAFFLCMGALSKNGITVQGLRQNSLQGDRAVLNVLSEFGAEVTVSEDAVTVRKKRLTGCRIDAAQIPDLIPVLSVVAAAAEGETQIINAGRLRIKESDRLSSTAEMLTVLGARVIEEEEGLRICGCPLLPGGASVNPHNDHRIAMAAAAAASICAAPVEIQGSRCVEKSYPDFWEDLETLKIEEKCI